MSLNRAPVFAAVRTILLTRTGRTFTPGEIAAIDAAFDEIEPKDGPAPATSEYVEIAKSKFALGAASLSELAHVKPQLVACVKRAIELTDVDFRVNQGLRTLEEQKKAVAAGNSRTMKSKHLPQADGLAWAVDLVALVDGKITWDFNIYGHLAFAMDRAATELNFASHVRWGCAWDRVLSDFGGNLQSYVAEANAYAKRHPGSDLLDAPHFEWVS